MRVGNPKEPCPAPTHTKEAPVSGGISSCFSYLSILASKVTWNFLSSDVVFVLLVLPPEGRSNRIMLKSAVRGVGLISRWCVMDVEETAGHFPGQVRTNVKNLSLRGSARRTAVPLLLCFEEAINWWAAEGELYRMDLCAGVYTAGQQYWNLQFQKRVL